MNNLTLTPNEKGLRIDVYLCKELDVTRSFAQKIIAEGNVKIGEKPVKKNYLTVGEEEIKVSIKDPENTEILAEDIPLDIVYEDDDIIIINKAKGMVVHPAPGNYTKTLVNALMFHAKDRLSSINGVIRPGIVHRIDKDTTGLLVVCKNDKAHLFVSEEIKNHSVERVYRAIVLGNLKEDSGTINKPIGRHKSDRKRMCVTSINSKEAITHYKVLARFQGYTYAEFQLETGRTHQIRVHLQSIGHPVLGDEIYGDKKNKFKIQGQCLHAVKLKMKHPKSLEIVEFYAKLPTYFEEILQKMEGN